MSRGRVLPLFALCAAALIGVMGWLTLTVRRLEDAERRGRDEAAREETVRLALWRMESQLAPLVAQESSRPRRLYGRTSSDRPSPYVRLHFEWDEHGRFSPEPPSGPDVAALRPALATASRLADRATLLARLSPEWIQIEAPPPPTPAPSQQLAASGELQLLQQKALSQVEFQARAAANAQNLGVVDGTKARPEGRAAVPQQDPDPRTAAPRATEEVREEVRVGLLQPLWFADELVLARRVQTGTRERVQVCWLDWPALRSFLLASVQDLLPSATLVPVASADEDGSRRLAALPVRLLPGAVTTTLVADPSGLKLPLLAGWILAFLALATSGALLFGIVTLGERRAAFVSAVTHELRTPLTTFRIYADMLREGMVTDEEQRRQYLATLSREAERQSHLVENVLAYSRLERGRYTAARETMTLAELLERVGEGLVAQAAQAAMRLEVSVPPELRSARVRVDRSAVDRILFNLVDNACKYARSASDRRIHLEVTGSARSLELTVRDHGPGIDGRERRRLFRPFHKSARDAAQSAPGVGLGLSLSRRLARALGGELRAVRTSAGGAAFSLRLPLAREGAVPTPPL